MIEPWELPHDWRWKQFRDVARVASDLVDPADHGDLPHIAPNHIEAETGRLLPYRTVRDDGVFSAKHRFHSGQILYSKIRPYLAKAVVVDFDGLCSADMYPIETDLHPKYLKWWMLSREFTRRAAGEQARTILPKINRRALEQLPVPTPPAEEQRRVVEILEDHISRLDAAGALLTAQVTSLEAFLEASIRNAIHEATAQGSQVTLGDLADIDSGPAFRSADFRQDGDGTRLLRGDNIEPGSLRWTRVRTLPDHLLAAHRRLLISEGDIILAMDRPVISTGLKLAVARSSDLPALLVQRVARIRAKPNVMPMYLHALMRDRQFVSALVGQQVGTQLPHITLKSIRDYRVPSADPALQRQLVDRVGIATTGQTRLVGQLVDGQVRSLALRRALLSAAFSGKLTGRSPDEEVVEAESLEFGSYEERHMAANEGGG